jgi:hypothetical protein
VRGRVVALNEEEDIWGFPTVSSSAAALDEVEGVCKWSVVSSGASALDTAAILPKALF